jgi:site-specific DNA-adenine methylase
MWMGRSAKAGTTGEFNGGLPVRWNANGGDSNTRYRSAVRSIVAWRGILARCNFTCLNCFDFLKYVQDNTGHGVYCDPPFPETGDAYKHSFTEEQHRLLAKRLTEFRKTRVVCRFYEHPLIRELYPEPFWAWQRHTGRKQSGADAPEVLLVRTLDPVTGLF